MTDLEEEINKVYLQNRERGGNMNMLVILNEKQFSDIARHFAEWQKQRMIEKAVKWLSDRIHINQEVECNEDGQPYAASYLDYCEKRLKAVEEITNDFRKTMEE